MNQCKQCGATLPENTQYCLQCGTEVPRDPLAAQPQGDLEFLKPALTGGLFLGVLSAIPLIGSLNIICCLWAQAGGGLATWLLNKQRPGTLKYGDGAFAGVISGLIGAFVATLITIPIELVMLTPEAAAQIQARMSQVPMAPPMRELFVQFFSPGFNLYRTLFWLVFYMVLFGLFSMIGGILTVALLNRKKTD
jgi:uncharacterized membrane protein YeaQ/YmgE (transglycosylase-associated protein family)